MSDELQDRINSLLGGQTADGADAQGEEAPNAAPAGDDMAQAIADQAIASANAAAAAPSQNYYDADVEDEEVKKKNLNLILDIPLEVSVELGRNKMLIQDLLQLGQGSVIELNKLAGEPLEVLVNGRLVARGEVVVIHDKFGVRLTDIISANERIAQLSS